MTLLSTSEEIGHFLKHRALSTKLGILTESIILQNFKIQNIAKCTISTFKCTKKFQNTPVKIYRTSDRTYVPKKKSSLSLFLVYHVVNEPDYSSHRELIEYRTFEQILASGSSNVWRLNRKRTLSKTRKISGVSRSSFLVSKSQNILSTKLILYSYF